MMPGLDGASVAVLSELLAAAGRSLALAGVAAAGVAAFRVRSTSLRLFVWSGVLYATLALPILGWMLPPLQVPLPQLLQPLAAQGNPTATDPQFVAVTTKKPSMSRHAASRVVLQSGRAANLMASPEARPNSVRIGNLLRWQVVASGIYLLGVLFLLARFLAAVVFSRRLVRGSRTIDRSIAAGLAGPSSLRLAASELITVPVTVGTVRPTILLPSDWQAWDRAKLNAVLAHELSHVGRRDSLTQRVALLHRAIFWFNPLAWWLNRHLSELAEQASDEAALSRGADQHHYARTLLSFFEAAQHTPGRIRWQGVSMARAGQAEQRLERILAWKGTVTMNLKRSLFVAVIVLGIPVVYLAASVRPAPQAVPSVPPAPATPAVSARPSVAPVAGIPGSAPVAGIPAPAIAPEAPQTPEAPEPPPARGFAYAYGFGDTDSFVIVTGNRDAYTMSGDIEEIHHVDRLKRQIPGDFIWFEREGQSYIIRDKATIDRARSFWTPQNEIGKKQEELGKQQEELGRLQDELGRKMEEVKVNVPDMTAELDSLKAKLQKLGSTATMEQISELQSEIGELQGKIGEIQEQAGEQQSKLGEQQEALGAKQGKIGELQEKLGRQQEDLAQKATRQMKQLFDQSLKNGTAKPEEEIVKSSTL